MCMYSPRRTSEDFGSNFGTVRQGESLLKLINYRCSAEEMIIWASQYCRKIWPLRSNRPNPSRRPLMDEKTILQSFMESFNVYRRFISSFAGIERPLNACFKMMQKCSGLLRQKNNWRPSGSLIDACRIRWYFYYQREVSTGWAHTP